MGSTTKPRRVRTEPRRRRRIPPRTRSQRTSISSTNTLGARRTRLSGAGEWRNGRRAGLRSRCRVSGVEVRPLSRLPILDGRLALAPPVRDQRPGPAWNLPCSNQRLNARSGRMEPAVFRSAAEAPSLGRSGRHLEHVMFQGCVERQRAAHTQPASPRPATRPSPDMAAAGPGTARPVPADRPLGEPALYFPFDADHPYPSPRSPPSSSRSSCHPNASIARSTPPSAPSPGVRGSPASGPARRRVPSSSVISGPASCSTRRSTTSCRTPTARRSIQEDHPSARQRRRRGRPGRGRQAADLQGDRPGAPGGHARRLQALQLQARDRDDR